MKRCPVCSSARIVAVIGLHRRAYCASCGSRWVQDRTRQGSVRRSGPAGTGWRAGPGDLQEAWVEAESR